MRKVIAALAVAIGSMVLAAGLADAQTTSNGVPAIDDPNNNDTFGCPAGTTWTKLGNTNPGAGQNGWLGTYYLGVPSSPGTANLLLFVAPSGTLPASPPSGTILIVTITRSPAAGPFFATFQTVGNAVVWEARAKQGQPLRTWLFDPYSTGDTLPIQPNQQGGFGISHVSFCVDNEGNYAKPGFARALLTYASCKLTFSNVVASPVTFYRTLPPSAVRTSLGTATGTSGTFNLTGTFPAGTVFWVFGSGSNRGADNVTLPAAVSCNNGNVSASARTRTSSTSGGALSSAVNTVTKASPAGKAAVALPLMGVGLVLINRRRTARRSTQLDS